jgi:serum/glucocorticoid-regulated kinase 2
LRERTGTLFSKKGENVNIEDFSLIKVLGRGAFGKVMLAEKKDSGELFAIKSLRKEEIIDREQLEHARTEKKILEHINHPFLVNLAYAF